MTDQAVILQQSAQGIGMNIDLQRMPKDGYWSNIWTKKPFTIGNINPRPSPDVLFTLFFKSDSPFNETGWKNERFDGLLIQARGETDFAKRKAIYGEMQQLIHDQDTLGVPTFFPFLDAHTTKLKGLSPIPTGGVDGLRLRRERLVGGVRPHDRQLAGRAGPRPPAASRRRPRACTSSRASACWLPAAAPT